MSKRIKIKEIKQIIGDSSAGDINGMFEEMMGMKDADKDIILPKFVQARNLLRHIYKVLYQFSNFIPLYKDFPEFKTALEEIKTFATELKSNVVLDDLKNGTEETEEMYENMAKEDLNAVYKKLKNNSYVARLIVLCGRLKQYSKCFEDNKNLKDNFIGQEPGLSLIIFDFSTLDLKKLWVSDKITPTIKNYVLNILYHVYHDIFQLYKTVTSPDVDIDKFTEILVESINHLRKQPGLSRCNNAFNRITKSVELLKDRFDNYYRESIASSNPNMIIESFIIDVSNQGGADARLTREFRQIIQYMHKVNAQSNRAKDPNIQKIFSLLNKNFELMEKKGKTNSDAASSASAAGANTVEKSSLLDDLDLSKKEKTA